MLIEFYAPWCSHCKKFENTYQSINYSLQQNHPDLDITVAKVDGSNERALASRFNVRGFPSFFLIDGWSVWSYNGPRTQPEIVKFVSGAYKKNEPIPFLNSPFGPLGLIKTWLMYVGIKLIDVHSWLVQKGLSNIVAAGLLAMFGFTSFVVSIVVIGVTVSLKTKTD